MRKLLIYVLIGLVIYLIASKCKEVFTNTENNTVNLTDENYSNIKNVLKSIIDKEYLNAQGLIIPKINKQIIEEYRKNKNNKDEFNAKLNQILDQVKMDETLKMGMFNDLMEDELFGRDMETTIIRKIAISEIIENIDVKSFNESNQKLFNDKVPVGLISILLKYYDFKRGEFTMNLEKVNKMLKDYRNLLN